MKIKHKLGLTLVAIFGVFLGWLFATQVALAAPKSSGGSSSSSCNYAACSQADVTSASGFKFTDQGHITAKIGTRTVTFTDTNPTDGNHTYEAPKGTFCSGGGEHNYGSIVVNDWNQATAGAASINASLDIDYFQGGQCSNVGNPNDTQAVATTNTAGAALKTSNSTDPNAVTKVAAGQACTSGGDCDSSSGTCVAPTGGGVPDCFSDGLDTNRAESECEANSSGFGLRWLFCPILASANWLANTLTNLFEQQLSFTLDNPHCSAAAACTNTVNDTTGLRKAWSIFRILASSLVVIVLLVAVVSEAMGGPLDAYTIRKIMPKLVIAVVGIQLSWNIYIWVVHVVDDLGVSLADMLYAPFGGHKVMTLQELFAHAHISAAAAGGTLWIGLIGVVVATAVAAPAILLLCFTAIIALVTGLAVLIFRKMIIIMALIFAPLALLAAILPGTQRYWQLWKDNVLKSLFMFPLVVSLVAVGRIFAYVAGTTGNGTFINFFLVFIGFFGPLFILPKAYQWGGGLMRATGNIASKGFTGAAKPLSGYLGWRKETSRWAMARQARKGYQQRRFARDMYRDMNATGATGALNRARLRGIGTPAAEQQLIGSISRSGLQAAEADELKEAQGALSEEMANAQQRHGISHDQLVQDYATAHEGDTVHGRRLGQADIRAARDQLPILGGPNNTTMEALHHRAEAGRASGTREGMADYTEWQKFLSGNADKLLGKFPMFYKSADYSLTGNVDTTVRDINAETFTKDGMDTEGMRTVMGVLSHRAATGDATAQQQLQKVFTAFHSAMSSETTRQRITPEMARTMLAAASGGARGNLPQINAGRGQPYNPTIHAGGTGAVAAATPGPVHADILAHVNDDGGIHY